MIIETILDVVHAELMAIFFKANDLSGIITEEYVAEIRGKHHKMLRFSVLCEATAIGLTFMGVRHAGIKNMFDHYLMACGVPVDELRPASYNRQLQEEREAEENERFMANLTAKMTKYGKINENIN